MAYMYLPDQTPGITRFGIFSLFSVTRIRRLFIYVLSTGCLLFMHRVSQGQSLSLMPGTAGFFVDIQWLKPLEPTYRFTLFSRTRAAIDTGSYPDLFTGAYLNYTTPFGLGASLVGSVASQGAGGSIGVHYFKQSASLSFFGLLSVAPLGEPSVAWFSILRYQPELNADWKLYTSFEWYSLFDVMGHRFSVHRLRVGLDRGGYQFGLALNQRGIGPEYRQIFFNPGIFIRSTFD